MSEISAKQIIFVVVMALLLLIIVPVLESRTGKSLREILFGFPRKKKNGAGSSGSSASAPAREPRINNGTKGELTAFVAQLLRFTSKNGMRLVAPGTITYRGKTSRLTSLIVTPSGVIGIYCLGFGGTITPNDQSGAWKQHINGEDKTFENPLSVCKAQYDLVRGAMNDAGIWDHLEIVTVFTNARATLVSKPASSVYTQKEFMDFLKNTHSLTSGNNDIERTALTLAELAGIKNKKTEKKKK